MNLFKRQARAKRRAKSMRLRRWSRGTATKAREGEMLTPSKFGWSSHWQSKMGLTPGEWMSVKKKARRVP
jgi:hypothetical protein